jgi:hypothetical protein
LGTDELVYGLKHLPESKCKCTKFNHLKRADFETFIKAAEKLDNIELFGKARLARHPTRPLCQNHPLEQFASAAEFADHLSKHDKGLLDLPRRPELKYTVQDPFCGKVGKEKRDYDTHCETQHHKERLFFSGSVDLRFQTLCVPMRQAIHFLEAAWPEYSTMFGTSEWYDHYIEETDSYTQAERRVYKCGLCDMPGMANFEEVAQHFCNPEYDKGHFDHLKGHAHTRARQSRKKDTQERDKAPGRTDKDHWELLCTRMWEIYNRMLFTTF